MNSSTHAVHCFRIVVGERKKWYVATNFTSETLIKLKISKTEKGYKYVHMF